MKINNNSELHTLRYPLENRTEKKRQNKNRMDKNEEWFLASYAVMSCKKKKMQLGCVLEKGGII